MVRAVLLEKSIERIVYPKFFIIENDDLHTVKIKKIRTLEKISHDMTKPTKWLCIQQLSSAWESAQSDQSLCCALNG